MTAANRPRSNPAPSPAEVAALLRRVVAAVEDGTLDASSSRARRLLRRLDQVADAFDTLAIADSSADEGTGDAGP